MATIFSKQVCQILRPNIVSYAAAVCVLVAGLAGASNAATFVVNKVADTNDGVCDVDCSLREAIGSANSASTGDVINFDPAVFAVAQTIVLSGTALEIANNGTLSINGPGATLLTVSGNSLSRVFMIQGAQATLKDLRITGGKVIGNGDGGGVFNNLGNVTINNAVVSNNTANGASVGCGGGIYNRGTMSINSTTIRDNAAIEGGGLCNSTGTAGGTPVLTVIDSLVISNGATGNGGGIYNDFDSTLNLVNTTVRQNSGLNGGGVMTSGPANLTDAILDYNSAQNLGGGICGGARAALTLVRTGLHSNTAQNGGGLFSNGDFGGSLNLADSTVSFNSATLTGGGVSTFRSSLTISASRILENSAPTGGGVHVDGGSSQQTIQDSSIGYNVGAANGGGIYLAGGTLALIRSGVYNNNSHAVTGNGGGGICVNSGILTAINSTIVGNRTEKRGGGIWNGATVNVTNTTISNNSATLGSGGVHNADFRIVNARNTIFADNSAPNIGTIQDFGGTLSSQGFNIVENTVGTTITGITTGNLLGLDPRLRTPQNNGGASNQLTVGLHPSSPAIDSGDPNNFPSVDQRGVARPQDGDLNGISRADIGAYEVNMKVFTVTKTADTNDGICNADCSLREAVQIAGVPTLPLPEVDRAIVFDPALFNTPQTIALSLGELVTLDNYGTYTLIGTGRNNLTITGGNVSRVFSIGSARVLIKSLTITGGNGISPSNSGYGGAVQSSGWLALDDVVLRNNSAGASGGGLYSAAGFLYISRTAIENNSAVDGGGLYVYHPQAGQLDLSDVTISGNSASGSGAGIWSLTNVNAVRSVIRNNNVNGDGGGIYHLGHRLTLVRVAIRDNVAAAKGAGVYNDGAMNASMSSFTNNSAGANGGGIYNSDILDVINSTVALNSTDTFGGGIYNDAPGYLTLSSATIAANSADFIGGGVFNHLDGDVTARNTIFGDNTAVLQSPDFERVLTSEGFNLIENTGGTTITGNTTGNILGQDPGLSALSSPNDFTFVRKLLPGSPAIDKANPGNFPPLDQRGTSRPKDGDRNGTPLPDIGAVERDPVLDGTSPFDFDGDGKTDLGIFRPGVAEWWINRSSNGTTFAAQFGASTDRIAPGDYTGDGKADIAIWRPSSGEWFILRSEDSSFFSFPFGTNGDTPMPADYDNDGKVDAAVFRESTATWYIRRSSDGGTTIEGFGANGDVPVVADYDGDGKSDIAIYRPSLGQWWIKRSTAGVIAFTFGTSTDKPVQGDYTGDGKADVAFWRPSTGEWYILRSEDFSYYSQPFGTSTDIPSPGDYDGDGKFDPTVFRPSSATWFSQRSTAGTLIQQFGSTGDQPIPNAFVP